MSVLKPTAEELKTILSNHSLWFNSRYSRGVRANLSGADLSGANLSGADLSAANLSGADLSGANLSHANLSHANLSHANLSHANLSHANLSHANLYLANLSGANLYLSNLYLANLSHANLSDADLYLANLSHANLSDADLSHANLSHANLSHANLSDAYLSDAVNSDLILAQTSIVPEGILIGWKKCQRGVIVKLEIPAHAKRSNATGRKCRASEVRVLEVFGSHTGVSKHDGTTKYIAGKTVRCNGWEPNRFIECAGGIHFFLTRVEAENY